MKLKFNLSQKLLIIIAVILFAAGVCKLIYFQTAPLNSLLLGFNNLIGSTGFEQDIMASCWFGTEYLGSQSIPAEMINDMLITANYKKAPEASKVEFSLKSRNNQNVFLSGEVYNNKNFTVFTLNDKTFYTRHDIQTSSNTPNNLKDILAGYKQYFKHLSKAAVTVNDYGKPTKMVMDNFSFLIEGDECSSLLSSLVNNVEMNNDPGFWEFIEQIPAGSVRHIYAMFQLDDFIRLRGVHSEIQLNEATLILDINTTRISRNINITSPDITNGLDISNFSEDEKGALFNDIFDSLAGGK